MKTVPVLTLDEYEEDRPMPSRNHAYVTQNIGSYLHVHYRDRYRVYPQLSLNLEGWQTIPDLAVYPVNALAVDWKQDEDEVTIPPLLVIETVSPHQTLQPLVEKLSRYLENGVKSCWQILPMNRTTIVYAQDGEQEAFSKGILRDPTLNIEIPMDEMFA